MKDLLELLTAHTEDGGTFYLEYQPQRGVYETVEQWMAQSEDRDDSGVAECVAANSLIRLQWYNATPVGFFTIYAPTWERMGARVREVIKQARLVAAGAHDRGAK